MEPGATLPLIEMPNRALGRGLDQIIGKVGSPSEPKGEAPELRQQANHLALDVGLQRPPKCWRRTRPLN